MNRFYWGWGGLVSNSLISFSLRAQGGCPQPECRESRCYTAPPLLAGISDPQKIKKLPPPLPPQIPCRHPPAPRPPPSWETTPLSWDLQLKTDPPPLPVALDSPFSFPEQTKTKHIRNAGKTRLYRTLACLKRNRNSLFMSSMQAPKDWGLGTFAKTTLLRNRPFICQ